MHITSLQNEHVKHLVKLRDDRRQRERDRLFVVEGLDEINLALAAGYSPRMLVACPDLTSGSAVASSDAESLTVSRLVFQKISYRENPDGWLAVFPMPAASLAGIQWGRVPLALIAESIEKPGNLGAILRTSDAAGVDALLVSDARVDIYNPNVVRASRGTLFTVPVVQASSQEILGLLRQHGMQVLAATPSAARDYTGVDMRGPIAIAVGTEDQGLTKFWLGHADLKVRIPMLGKVNSLNVSIAAALLTYEALRQRRV